MSCFYQQAKRLGNSKGLGGEDTLCTQEPVKCVHTRNGTHSLNAARVITRIRRRRISVVNWLAFSRIFVTFVDPDAIGGGTIVYAVKDRGPLAALQPDYMMRQRLQSTVMSATFELDALMHDGPPSYAKLHRVLRLTQKVVQKMAPKRKTRTEISNNNSKGQTNDTINQMFYLMQQQMVMMQQKMQQQQQQIQKPMLQQPPRPEPQLPPAIPVVTFKQFQSVKPPKFEETADPIKATTWLKEIEKAFALVKIKFLELKQGNMSMTEYEDKFTELARFVPEQVNTEEKRAQRFQLGLQPWIRGQVAVFELTTYIAVVQKAMIIEGESERSQKER
ncbi:hypothetical protein AgCh_022109 [Apium graveolens]